MPARDFELRDVFRAKRSPQGETAVLRGVSGLIEAGAYLGVAGSSGSGKTTLLRLLNRLEDADAGEVLYGGAPARDWDVMAHRRRVALVTQRSTMFPGGVLDNVTIPDALSGRAPDPERARSCLATARLADVDAARDSAALSVGQQARVALARALYVEPEVLMIDEATAHLDGRIAGEILDDIERAFARDGRSIVHVTHEPAKLRRCRRLWVLDGGTIVQSGAPDVVLADAEGPAARILAEARS